MPINTATGFDYKGPEPNFNRDLFDTIEDMKNFPESNLPELFLASCKETGKFYSFNKNNIVIEETGKWRECGNDKILKNISYAQKTVNEVGTVSLLKQPYSFTAIKTETSGTGTDTTLNETLVLKDDITNFDYIEILLTPNGEHRKRVAQITRCRVNTIVFNNTNTINISDGSIIIIPFNIEANAAGSFGEMHFSINAWFMDSKTLYISKFKNPSDNGYWVNFEITDIIGVKDKTIIIDPVEYVNSSNGIEDTPVGHIISYMGNTAPKHYLVCDGSEYNISDYPNLVQHFITEFGSVNHFGGDGVNTFAVPDLRGEFLRGTGTNSHQSGCNGATVGEHQDGSDVVGGYFGSTSGQLYVGEYMYHTNMNTKSDNWIPNTGDSNVFNRDFAYSSSYPYTIGKGTSRPTNTSVLYCIKYEPTYFMKNTYSANNVYYKDEHVIGRWINGKPLYRRVIETTTPNANASIRIIASLDTDCDIIKVDGTFFNTTTKAKGSVNFAIGQYYISTWSGNNNDPYNVYCITSGYTSMQCTLIIEYTRLSDPECM